MSALETAIQYIGRGWSPIPIPYRSKKPTLPGWNERRLTNTDAPRYFREADQNIGVLLGAPSGGLVDIDLDSPEALALAPFVLPQTATFGRASTPQSHWLYMSLIPSRVTYVDPLASVNGDEGMLLEIRSTGAQTVFPGSVHETGERIEWFHDRAPCSIEAAELQYYVGILAAMSLLRRHWPAAGARDEAAVALTGLLTRTESFSEEQVANIVTLVNGGESLRKHLGLARGAAARLSTERPLQGIPAFRKIFGAEIAVKVLQWLGLSSATPTLGDVSERTIILTTQSSAGEVAEVVALLRAAHVGPMEAEAALTEIARRTGRSILTLRKELRGKGGKKERASSSASEALVEIGKHAELFFDAETFDACAQVHRDGHAETLRIGGTAFREWLTREAYAKSKSVPDKAAMGNAINTLSSLARLSGVQHRTWLRVARDADAIYVDLGDPSWQAVRITADGWEVVQNPPVRFVRASGHALPTPQRGGSIDEFRRFVNTDDVGFMLIVGVLVNAFRPDKPFPILLLTGQKGSAKSTLLVLLRKLLDPASAAGAGLPFSERDLVVIARNNWLVSGDNVSYIKAELSDAFCRLATGGGMRTRRLFTDGEEFALDVRRPVIMTALTAVTSREDFLDRVVMVTLSPIEGARKTEEEVFADFEGVCAHILGVLFDGVASALRRMPFMKLDDPPRMADFANFATAGIAAYGWDQAEFMLVFEAMRDVVFEDAAMSDPFVALLVQWCFARPTGNPAFDGSPAELLGELFSTYELTQANVVRSRAWPKSAPSLAKKLLNTRTGLEAAGIDVTVGRDNDNRSRIVLRHARIQPTASRSAVVRPEDPLPF